MLALIQTYNIDQDFAIYNVHGFVRASDFIHLFTAFLLLSD
jgi:hypothetical protein